MQLSKRLTGLFALLTIASAASYNDVCNIGYCTLGGGTSGGSGGTVTTVTTLSALTSAISGTDKRVVVVSGTITGTGTLKVGSNKSIIGLPGSHLSGVGLSMNNQTNVIFRNLKISKVVGGDGIGIQWSSKVWVDHCDVSSDRSHGLDYYDGAVDLTHATTYATLSYNYLHDHMKCVLIGADDSNTEDKVMTVTFYGNYYNNLQTRTPMARFGTYHIVNNYFNDLDDSISTYMGAQMLVEYNVWENSVNTVKTSKTDTRGYAVVRNNDYGSAQKPNMTAGTFTTAPYTVTIAPLANVKANAQANAGQKLTFTTTSSSQTSSQSTTSRTSTSSSGGCTTPLYGQCGGSGFTGCTTCASGSTCTYSNEWYSQCL